MHGSCNCGPGFSGRSFLTKEEKLEMLNDYREALEKEVQGVKERIQHVENN